MFQESRIYILNQDRIKFFTHCIWLLGFFSQFSYRAVHYPFYHDVAFLRAAGQLSCTMSHILDLSDYFSHAVI